jgi:CRISPR/Cas system CSM-associated protein Csm4 (group 5 of RAMP superfamily)
LALIEIRLRPTGPWRVGHRTGDRERVDAVYHSDALYSSVTHAMSSLGWLEEWLDATANAVEGSAVRFGSLFPFVGDTRLLPPPRTAWPPSGAGKLYVNAAKLVPVEVARRGVINESRWAVDGASECLLPVGMAAPFEVSMRSGAAVDRITGHTEPHRTACLEFAMNAGWWGLVDIVSADWEARVKSALRLLADSGFGGERSRGWGRAGEPEFMDAASLFGEGHAGAWWMLSLYSPHADDAVDWSRGDYATVTRAGWTDSAAGVSTKKKNVRMIEEGSVLMAPALRGRAVDVAPEGFPHPTWRAGFALAVPVPVEVEA